MSKNLADATKEAMALEKALTRATQTDGTISYSKMAMELNKAGTNATQMVSTLASGGTAFQASLQAANKSLALSNRSAVTLGKTMKEIHRVFLQSFKFTAAQTVIRALSTEIQKSVQWVTKLNEAVNNIGVVTGKSAEELREITSASIQASKDLKVAASEYAEGALIFYQQGLDDEEVARRTEITIKAAKSANQSVEEMSSQLTAIWNNYRMIGEEQERSASVGAALAAKTAVDFSDIAKAMQTAAAPAAQMGVEYNQLAAIIATVGDVSQESASVIGNAYKTIFSRLQQLTTEGSDGEVTLNSVSSKLKSLGIEVMNMDGTLRNLGTVINEVGTNWDKWTETQQTAIAQIVGGTRQYGQFLTLMNNFDKYQKNLETAELEDGSTLESQYSQALDSITAKAEQSAEAWQRAFGEIIPEDALKSLYDMSTKIGNLVGTMLKGLGGLPGILSAVGVALSGKIVPAIITGTKNIQIWRNSLTASGREKNIKNDYEDQRVDLDRKISSGDYNAQETASMQTQKSKLEILKQIALRNEEINNQLRTATGSEKLMLQQQQQRLQTAIQLVEQAMNESQALQEQLNAQTQFNAATGTQALQGTRAELLEQQEQKITAINDLWVKIGQEVDKPRGQQNIARLNEYETLLQKLEEEVIEIELAISDVDAKLQSNTVHAVDEMAKGYGDVLKKMVEIERSGDSQTKKLESQKAVLQEYLANARQVVAAGSQWDKDLQNLEADLAGINEEEMARFLASVNETLEKFGAMDDQLAGLAGQVAKIVDDMNKSGGIANPLNPEKFVMPKVDTSQVISGFTQVGMSAAGALTSVTNLYKTLSNPDMTGFEKFTAAAMQIPMVMMQVQQASAGITAIMNQWNMAAESLAIKNMTAAASEKMVTGALTENQIALLAQYAALVRNGTETEIAAAKTQLLNAGLTEEAIAAAMASGGLDKASIAAQMFGLKSAAALGHFLIIAALVAAAVAAIVFAWKEYQNSKPEAKLERASEAAKNLSDAADEAKEAAQGLVDTFDQYKDAEKALENCKRGTDEWTAALRAANEAALAVVDALPDDINVADAYSRDADGRIRLNEDAIKEGQKSLDSAAQRASYTASTANIQASMARNDLSAANLGQTIANSQLHYDASMDAMVSDQSAARIAQLLTESAESFKNLADGDIEGFKEALKEAGISVENLTDQEIQSFASNLTDLGNATEAAREKMELVAKMAVDELLDGKNYDDDTKDVTGERIAAMTTDLTEKYLGALTNGAEGSQDWKNKYGDIYQAQTKINDDLMARYNELTGNNYASSGNGVQGTDTNRIFEFIDEQGNTIKKSAKQMAEEMAAAEALLNVEGAAADISRDFDKLNMMIENKAEQGSYNSANNGAMKASAVKNFIVNGDMNNLNDNELGAMAALSNEQIQESLIKMFDIPAEELDALAASYGHESGEAWAAAIHEAALASQTASEHAGDQLTKTTKKMYDSIVDDGDLTVQAKENLAKALKQVFDNFDTTTTRQFTDIMDKMGADANTLLENLTDIDWESASPDNLREKLNELGIDATKLSDEDLQQLIKSLRNVGDASLSAAQNFNANLKDAASGVKDNNSIISDEDFKALQEAGVNVGQFFGDMADGTHQLLGDADEFNQLIHSIEISKLQEVETNAQDKLKELESAKKQIEAIGSGGSILDETHMLQAMWKSGEVSNSERDDWISRGGTSNAEVAEEVRKRYEEAGMSAEKIEQMMKEAANEAERAQAAMDNADFAFEVESAGLDLEETTRYAERLKKEMLSGKDISKMSKDEMRLYAKAAQDAAINNQRLDRGIGSLKDNLKEYKKAIKDSNKGTAEWSEAMDALKKDIADIVGFDDSDLLSDSFAEATMDSEDLQKAINGDTEAIERLQAAAGEDMILNIQVSNDLTDAEFESVLENWNYLKTEMEKSITAGDIDQTDLVNSFNEMIKNGHMTKDQIEAALSALHVSANVKTTYTTSREQVPVQAEEQWWEPNPSADQTVPIFDDKGKQVDSYKKPAYIKKTKSWTSEYDYADVTVPSYEIEGTTDEGGNTTAFIDAPAPRVSKGGSKFSDATGSSSKGGGGGNSKTSTPKKKGDHKEAEKIKDRYTNIQSSIDKTTRLLERLADAEDDSWGYARFKNLRLINEQLGIQGKKLQILYKEAKAYLAEDQEALQEILRNAGIEDAIFNSDGFVANHENITRALNAMLEPLDAAVEAAEKAYDAAVDRGLTDDDLELYQKAIDDANDAMDKFNEKTKDKVIEALEQVDETAQKVHDTMSELIQNIREVMQNWVDKQKIKLDLKLEINNQDIRDAEHLVDLWGDIGTLMGENVKNYREIFDSNNKNAEALLENATTMQTMIEGLMRGDNDAGNWLKERFGDKAYDEWLNGNGGVPDVVMEQWTSSVEELQDVRDTMQETLRSMMQEWTRYLELILEDFDKLSQKLERNQETLDMWSKVLDGMGMAETVEGARAMAKLTKASYDTAKKTAHVYKEQALTAKAANENAEKALKDFKDAHGMIGDDVSNLTENELIQYQEYLEWVKQSEEALNDAESSFKSAVQDMVDKMGEVMEAETTRLRAEFFDKINGAFTDWDTMTEIYDGLEEIDDLTLDDLTKNYELDKLGTSISDYLENATNPEALEYGSKLLDEINAKMASGEKITQEQLEGYQKQFEVMQAMDAFEEAKNNKNTMRLARDASGNYSYVYSSDQSQSTEDKAQKLKDAIYEYEKLQQDAVDKYEDLWIQTYATIGQLEELKNTARYKNDEKYAKYVDEKLRQEYEKLDFYAEHIDLHYQQLNDFHEMALNEDSILFQNHVDHELETFKNSNLNMVMGTQDTYDKITDFHQHFVDYMSGPGGFAEQLEQTGDEIVTNTLGDIEEVGEGLDFMEGDYTHLAELVEEKSDEIIKDNEEIGQSATDLRKEATSAFNTMTSNIVSNSNQMVSALNKVTTAIKDQIAALQKLRQEQLNNIEKDEEKHPDWTETPDPDDIVPSPNTNPQPTTTPEPSQKPLNSYPVADQKGIAYAVWNGTAGWGNGTDRKARLNEKFGPDGYATYQAVVSQHDIIKKAKNGTWTKDIGIYSYDELRNRYGYNAFDTGGYTGNDEGLAILHEKELVLNAEDTKNILAAVAMMRQTVAGQLGSLNGALSASVGNISSIASYTPEPTSQAVDQQVRIEASFPGVSVAKEVEDALNDLINQAAQYNIKK